jgi:hypothetical protein
MLLNNSFVTSDFRHVTFDNVTNATCWGNYFYTAEYGDAWDNGDNLWYNESLGGNYWCNYTDYDDDGDGFGETPYDIEGGDNQDLYPIALPNPNVYEVLSDSIIALLIPVLGVLIVLMVFSSVMKSVSTKKGKRK